MKYILIIFTALFIQSCSSNFLDNMKGNLANKQVIKQQMNLIIQLQLVNLIKQETFWTGPLLIFQP